jgi:hypothetical protein
MTDRSPEHNSTSLIPWLLGVVVLIGAVVAFFLIPSETPQPEPTSTANLLEIVDLKNQAIAQLENNQLDEATTGFRTIIELTPNESLGYQNLTITALLKLAALNKAQEPDAYSSTQAELAETLTSWASIHGESPQQVILSARMYEAIEDRAAAIAAYLRAAELSKTDPVLPYQAFQLMQQRADEYDVSEKKAAIAETYQRSPENIAVVVAYLRFLAETQDDLFLEILEQARDLFIPLSVRVRETLPKLLDKAASAVKGGDWKIAQTQIGFTGNLLLAEIAYTNDLNRLNPHPLEYVAMDFSEDFYSLSAEPLFQSPAPIDVAFQTKTLELGGIESSLTTFLTTDLTLDGEPELIIGAGNRLVVYALPQSKEPLFQLDLPFEILGIVAADLDRDYQSTRDEALKKVNEGLFDTDLDLIVWGKEGLLLIQNEFQQADTAVKLSLVELPDELQELQQINDAHVADIDHDGDLDFTVLSQVGMTLWSNNGNWSFTNFTPFSHLTAPDQRLQKIVATDIDRNLLNDFVVAANSEPGVFLLENNLHGRYVSRPLNVAMETASAIAVVDVNRDASWDLLSVGETGLTFIPGTTLQSGGWKPGATEQISDIAGDGLSAWDYNNDGLLDVITWNAEGLQIYEGDLNKGLKHQAELTDSMPGAEQLEVIDFDGDGDQDLVLLSKGKVHLVINEGGNKNNWINVRLRAEEIAQTPRERCNMHGVGSLLEVKAGGLYQARIVNGPLTHFGLGQQSDADILRVLWTNGIPHNVLSPKTNGMIFEQQQLKGSCPYLYTWDGEKFVFATDCLWASPIGLQFAQGILAPARDWEYLKISEDLLVPKDGEYVLQMTEELWEAAYYDSVKLMTVDHPSEVDIFTNEKVGPAEIAEFQVHTARKPLTPEVVVDQQNRDLLSQVRDADGIYTKSWGDSYTQGLTETHWLEFSVGEYDDAPSNLKLFLTGWVFPTDTSLNIAISQNPEMPRPQPPMLQVPDENGEWQTVSPYIGFPGGKTKTIVVDLTDKFLTDDYRVRIVTNMEIRWDHLFYTVDETPAQFDLTELNLLGADLHDRGFSKRIPQPHNQSESFDYQSVTTQPLWPPMGGDFTRYGDVTELIEEGDDLQVVMGAGDEMTVRFAVPQKKLPEGWVRDFILYNIGWDKDADLNTVQGQQVEPLPFRGMKAYPYEPEQSFPNTPKHRDYLQEYQTRRQPRPSFRTEIRDWNSVR